MKKLFINSFLLISIGLLVTSCLKDEIVLDPSKTNNVIEFGNPSDIISSEGANYFLYSKSFDIKPEDTDYVLTVSYSGVNTAPEDINVTIGVGAKVILDQYNTQQGTNYVLLPPTAYSIPTTQVTIPRGQRTATAVVKIKSSQLTFNEALAIPFTIVSASSGIISSNFRTIIVNVSPKNRIDGVYRYQTSAITSLVPNKDSQTELATIGPNTVQIVPGLLDTYSNVVTYTVDPTTNRVTVVCPTLGVQVPQDTRSVYDPATKVMKVFWKQGNGNRTFEEVFTFSGPRL